MRACSRMDPVLKRVPVRERHRNRASDDLKVEQERPMLDVIEIVLDSLGDLLHGRGFTAPAIDLRPARDSGFHAVACIVGFHSLSVE